MNAVTARVSLFFVFGAAVALRGINHAQVFDGGDGVVFPAYDAYYHLVRAFQTMGSFPWVPSFDPGMSYPDGAVVVWPPLFDLLLAAVGLAAGGPGNAQAVEIAVAWLMPVIGAATVFPVYWLARQAGGRRAEAIGAAALFAASPVSVLYSGVGYLDHHAAVTFLWPLMFAMFLAATRKGAAHAVMAGLIAATGLLTWNGFILYVAIVDLWLFLLLAVEGRRAESNVAAVIWISHLVAAAVVAPFAAAQVSVSGHAFTGVSLSWFHVAAVGGAGLFALAVAWARPKEGELGLAPFMAAAVVAGAAGAALAWRGPLSDGAEWVFTTETFMSMVNESRPFPWFTTEGFAFTCRWMSVLFFVSPIVIAALAVRAAGEKFADRGLVLLLVAGTALFVLAAVQRRFGEAYAPLMAVMMAMGAGGWVRAADGNKKMWVRIALLATVAAGAHAGFYNAPARHLSAASYPFSVTGMEGYYRRIIDPFRRLAVSGPKPAGLMTTLTLGHMARYETGLPVVVNNFGSYIGAGAFHDWAAFFLAREEGAAADIMERRGLSYVALDYEISSAASAAAILGENPQELFRITARGDTVATQPSVRFMRSIWFRLSRLRGARGEFRVKTGGGALIIPALTRFRLLVDSKSDNRPGDVKIFEFVPGARLRLENGTPGAHVAVSYKFSSTAGRERVWRDARTFGQDGEASFHVPYSSELETFGHDSEYVIETQDVARRVFVHEKTVMEGGAMTVDMKGGNAEERYGTD